MGIVDSAMGECPSVDSDVRKRTLNDSDGRVVFGPAMAEKSSPTLRFHVRVETNSLILPLSNTTAISDE